MQEEGKREDRAGKGGGKPVPLLAWTSNSCRRPLMVCGETREMVSSVHFLGGENNVGTPRSLQALSLDLPSLLCEASPISYKERLFISKNSSPAEKETH